MSDQEPQPEVTDTATGEDPRLMRLRKLDEAITAHPGQHLARRLDNLKRTYNTWASFSVRLSALLDRCEDDNETIGELIRNVGDRSSRDALINSLDQATVAYVAGLGALIDHTRRVVEKESEMLQRQHSERLTALRASMPASVFLGKLRNYVLHYVAAPWEFTAHMVDARTAAAEVLLSSKELLKFDWNGPARRFIENSGEQIRLSPLLCPYLKAMRDLTDWVLERCWGDNALVIDGANILVRERNLMLSGGVTDGGDWEACIAHMSENIARAERGEPQTGFTTGEPVPTRPLV